MNQQVESKNEHPQCHLSEIGPIRLSGEKSSATRRPGSERQGCGLLADPHLEAAAVVARFDQHHAVVTAADYLNNLHFLLDFHGRDLLQAFRHSLTTLGINLSYESLTKELAAATVEGQRS